MYADGPSCFISGHGIDAVSNGVQTFRAYHCLVGVSGNVERVGGNRRTKKPAGFRTYFDVLFDPEFLLPPDDRGAAYRCGRTSRSGPGRSATRWRATTRR